MEKRLGLRKDGELAEHKVYVPREGDYVLLDSSRWGVKNKSKLQPRVLGPFLIEKVLGRNVKLTTPTESTFDPVVSCDDCILYNSEFYEDYPPELVLPKLIKPEDTVPAPASTKSVDVWHRDFAIDLGKKLGKVWPASVTKAEFEQNKDKHIRLHCHTKTGTDGELHDELTPVTFRKLIMGAPAIPNRRLHSTLFKFLVSNPQFIPPEELQHKLHIIKAIQAVQNEIDKSTRDKEEVDEEDNVSDILSEQGSSPNIEGSQPEPSVDIEVSSDEDEDAFQTQSTTPPNPDNEGSEIVSELGDEWDNASVVDYEDSEDEGLPPSTPPATPPSWSPKRFSVTKHPTSLVKSEYHSDSSITSSRHYQPNKHFRKSQSSSPGKTVKLKLAPEFEPISSRTRGIKVNYRQ